MNEPLSIGTEMVRVHDLALYLRKTGWHRVSHPNERLLVFRRNTENGHPPLTIVLASSDEYADGKERIADAIGLLAELQEVSPAELLRSVHSLDRDILAVRFLGTQSSNGGLSLNTATRLVTQLRELFAYAACVEENPRPYFVKATSIGRNYTEKCVFGHTFPGSFGFTIESPTGLGTSVSPGVDPPFERRVMSRIVRGIHDLREAVLGGDPDLLVQRYQAGLNANLCELLEDTLKEPDEHEIEYRVTWSPEWPVADDLTRVGAIRLQPGAADYLGRAARILRRLEESKPQRIIGKVVALQSEGAVDEDNSEEGEQIATVLWEQQKGRKLCVRMALEHSVYFIACDAHKLGLTVEVNGRLEKVGKFWTLMEPGEFKTVAT